MDKAEEIGTFETSIQPYEDCCIRIPCETSPPQNQSWKRIEESESHLDVYALVEAAVASRQKSYKFDKISEYPPFSLKDKGLQMAI